MRYILSKKYNDTLNLPKTDFPMKANLSAREPEVLDKWVKNDIYKKVLKKNSKNKKFVLHDGPPYANGEIHLGHALNKILKDFIVKYKSMRGFCSPFVPGWDTHGLPTEIKAKNSVKNYDSLSISELREICKKTAMHYVDVQREAFKRLGVFGDWENPYITFNPEFESKQIEVFAEMVKRGAIYRGLRPVYWCSCCKTALAEAEIEYKQDKCESIFVKFQVKNDLGKFSKLGIDIEKTYFLIWTTTTWTLPANVAICLNSNFNYSVVKVNGEFLIVASALVESCMQSAGISDFEIVANLEGETLENITVHHPFLDRESLIILGNHVNLESGTGCVHTAPGHGIEDFECCKGYNLEILVPVDDNGILNSEAGLFEGLNLEDANIKIVEHLEKSGHLFCKKSMIHKYPHCWRCKSPIIFRATNQWFCSVDSFKEKAVDASLKVKWIPGWGKQRIESMIRERSDWCISRQRRWGVPIPIFFCKDCGEPLVDYSLMKHISSVFAKHGSNIWYEKDASYFLTNGESCSKCGSKNFVQEKDIMDVWFDSGSTHYAVLKDSEFPADLYLEGSDQYRGWFQSSLLTSVGIGREAPYKSVLTHGWVVDEESRKQSKSLGNVIAPSSIIEKNGADVLRLWASSVDYTDNVKISNEILSQIGESYRKIRNTARFILGNLYDFDPKSCVKFSDLESVDKFILIKFKSVFENCINFYDNYEFYSVFHEIQKFCITDLSNFYLDIIKDRLYVSAKDGILRKSAQTTIWVILYHMTKILAPILSFTCEEIWSFIPKLDNLESVFLSDISLEYEILDDSKLIKYWNDIIEVCDFIKKHLEIARKDKIIGSSLEADVYLNANSSEVEGDLEVFIRNVKDVCMISSLNFVEFNPESDVKVTIKKSKFEKCQRCWMYDESVGKNEENPDLCSRCLKVLN